MPSDLLISAGRAAEVRAAVVDRPSFTLGPGPLADLEMLVSGAYAPLTGYLTAAERAAVATGGTLPDGKPWPLPLGLDVPAGTAMSGLLALRDREGDLIAVLHVTEVTAGPDGTETLAGPVEGLRLPAHPDHPALRRYPADAPAGDALGVMVPGLLHAADIAALRLTGRPVVVLAPCGGADPADATHHGRVRALLAATAVLSDGAVRSDGAVLPGGPDPVPARVVLVPLPPRPTGPVERALRAHVAAAYGFTDPVLDPAPGSPADAVLDDLLDRGEPLPASLTPPAVAAELVRSHPPRHRQGLTVLFSGLSGSGKSTVAALLAVRLLEAGDRRVTLLDGDVVRTHLSKGLGFSRADRETNVARIGFVAAQVTAAGGIAVCAPIAPYDVTRRSVRAEVERGGGFVLVHVATPLEVCEARDRKGLYAKARAGLLPGFTGIDDPYEVPADAELMIDTSTGTPAEAADTVLAYLHRAGWLRA